MDAPLFRLGRHEPGVGMAPHRFDNVFEWRESRCLVAPDGDQIPLLLALARRFSGPFRVVYDLLVSFGTKAEGRYELAESLDYVALEILLNRFRNFFESDARHHLFVGTLTDNFSVLYDQHNVFYVQGPKDVIEEALRNAGLKPGKVELPNPHTHHYHEILDPVGDELFASGDWARIGEPEIPLENTMPIAALDEIGER